jgi:menaquinone-dependent protoporphyrinogen oxidase
LEINEMNILILYGSIEGQTEKIAYRISQIARHKDHQVTVSSCEQLISNNSIDDYEAVIIGGSIHMGKYPKSIKRFVVTHCDWLNTIPTAFFTVCMAIQSTNITSREEAVRYGTKFTAQTGWKPKLVQTFAGAVKYTRYNFITKMIMKLITRREGGSTDTSRDHEYTDWESVDRFAEEFLLMIGNG